jgi:hypothetical protein
VSDYYDHADLAEEDRPQPYQVPPRYRRYNNRQRKAHAERLQRYREHNEQRRRRRGAGTQGTD